MKSNLSNSFFGSKKFLYPQYQQLQQTKTITDQQIHQIFQPYTQLLSSISTQNNSLTLFQIFAQFIRNNAYKFISWPYQKLSAWLQLSAHVFQYSFEKHLNKKQSYQYFSQVVIRHSLFRPPHSVNVFNYQQAQQIRQFWVDNFVRYYEQYRMCFQSQLNQIVETIGAGQGFNEQAIMGGKKQISRQDFTAKFGSVLEINPAPKKNV